MRDPADAALSNQRATAKKSAPGEPHARLGLAELAPRSSRRRLEWIGLIGGGANCLAGNGSLRARRARAIDDTARYLLAGLRSDPIRSLDSIGCLTGGGRTTARGAIKNFFRPCSSPGPLLLLLLLLAESKWDFCGAQFRPARPIQI